MRRPSVAWLAWGLLAVAALGCGLSFGDLSATGDAGPPLPDASATKPAPTATPTTPPTTPPVDDDAATPSDGAVDAFAFLDAGADAAGDARPPPTNVPPRIVLRFELNFRCEFLNFNSPFCTRNEGTFSQKAVYHGTAAELLNTPGGAFGTNLNFWRANNGGGASTNAIDIEDATDAVPVGTTVDRLTVAAWVRRVSDGVTPERDDIRILSFGPEGTGTPLVELGYNKASETKLALSIGEVLGSGKKSVTRGFLLGDEWTFVAATYDPTAADELCLYRGTEATEVVLVECLDYASRSFARAQARFSVGNASTASTRNGAKKVSFPGQIDNVFVYFGDALDLAELKKLQRD